MPSPFTSAETLADARLLASRLGIDCPTISIERLYATALAELAPRWPAGRPMSRRRTCRRAIPGHRHHGPVQQVRLAGADHGQQERGGHRVLHALTATCRRTGGDQGRAQDLVFELARWRNRQSDPPPIPASIIARPPTASCGTASGTRTRCRPTRCWTRSWRATSSATVGRGDRRDRLRCGDRPAGHPVVDLSEYNAQGPRASRSHPKASSRDRGCRSEPV